MGLLELLEGTLGNQQAFASGGGETINVHVEHSDCHDLIGVVGKDEAKRTLDPLPRVVGLAPVRAPDDDIRVADVDVGYEEFHGRRQLLRTTWVAIPAAKQADRATT